LVKVEIIRNDFLLFLNRDKLSKQVYARKTGRFNKSWKELENLKIKLPECRHKQVDILKWEMERIAEEFIGRNTIIQVYTLPHSIIRMQHFFYPTLFAKAQKYR
jgi:hypothetical protein